MPMNSAKRDLLPGALLLTPERSGVDVEVVGLLGAGGRLRCGYGGWSHRGIPRVEDGLPTQP